MVEEKRFYVDLNLKGNELKNFKLQRIDSVVDGFPLPADAFMFFDTSDNRIKYHDGTDWQVLTYGEGNVITDIQVDAGSTDYITVTIVDGVATIALQTVDAGTIEHQELSGAGTNDHAAIDAHLASTENPHGTTLEQARTANNRVAGNIEMGDGAANSQIKNLAPGTAPLDGVNLAQLQAAELGLKVANHAQWATTEALAVTAAGSKTTKTLTATANGALALDGGVPAIGARIIVKDQVNKVDNGVFVVSVTGDASNPFVLTRDTAYDDDPAPELLGGMYFFVQYGTANNSTGWVVQAVGVNHDTDPDVDTDPITFVQFTAANSYTADGVIVINGSVISFNASAAAGKGLEEVDGYENKLQVIRYEPTENTGVAVGKTITTVSVGVGTTNVVHNMSGKVIATIFDEADATEVEVGVKYINPNTIQIQSNIAFTATIELVRTSHMIVIEE
jgi:hypothetical protein